MKPSRHQIAAGVTVLALGLLATVALASGGKPEGEGSGAPVAATSAPEVRTEIVRQTVHRRAKGRVASGASGGSGGRGSGAVRSSSSPSPGRPAAPAAAAAPVAPVASPDHHRGRGRDDHDFDDHGGRGRGRDDDDHGFADHGGDRHDDDGGHGRGRGRGRGGDDD